LDAQNVQVVRAPLAARRQPNGVAQFTESYPDLGSDHRHLQKRFRLERHGSVDIKGKGPMETYFLLARADETIIG